MSTSAIALPSKTMTSSHFSIHNAVKAELACQDSTCRAYVDILTAARWKAQGFKVRENQLGTKIQTWTPCPKRQNKMLRTATVYCRHQVERI